MAISDKRPRIGMEGFYQLYQYRTDDNGNKIESTKELLAGDQFNLIVDNGFQMLGSTSGFLNYLKLGSGTTEPKETDTELENYLMSARTTVTAGPSDLDSTPAYVSANATASFSIGAEPPEISEIGAGKSAVGDLFSRALIKDGNGTPVTVKPFPNATLDMVYQWRIYFDFDSDATMGTFEMDGNTYATTTHLGKINTSLATSWNLRGLNFSYSFQAYSGAFGDPGSDPTTSMGTLDDKYIAPTLVTEENSFYINVGANIPPSSFVGDISALQAGVVSSYLKMKTGFTPPISKPDDQNFFVGIQIPIARYHN